MCLRLAPAGEQSPDDELAHGGQAKLVEWIRGMQELSIPLELAEEYHVLQLQEAPVP